MTKVKDDEQQRKKIELWELDIYNVEELSKLLGDVAIGNGGVMPNIYNLLLPKKARTSSKNVGGDDDS
ncbi:hypothetical protein PRUPE_8G106800 [Prunus persica]|uniref:Histone H2A C-terminal domain-containing protein n=1 Tax=Prunus persica TaxID=3760 RepID=M5VLH8_PRUPE|nr:hypothetical protein PRUPE_8G106800 [Prunus persica]